jgi:hypothetical protein
MRENPLLNGDNNDARFYGVESLLWLQIMETRQNKWERYREL